MMADIHDRRRTPAVRSAPGRPPRGDRSGFAVLTVLIVLLALLVLTTPFLMTARNASKSSTQMADRAQLRLALDAAERHARGELGLSHPATDVTPYFDDEEELRVDANLDPAFFDTRDASGVMFGVDVQDVAGLIDVNSASPFLFANLFGTSTRITKAVKATDEEIPVSSTQGFEDVGFVWIGRELIGYTERTPRSFRGLQRGLLGQTDSEGRPLECGPQPPMSHSAGTPVIDQRAFAAAQWRIFDAELVTFDAPEHVREAGRLALGAFSDEHLDRLGQLCTTYAELRGGRRWQRPTRLRNELQGGIDCTLRVDEGRWFNAGTTVEITDGETTEYGIVMEMLNDGFRLMDPVTNDYRAYSAEVRALVRRPVNVNVASVDVLRVLLENLQVRGVNSRVTGNEASALAELIVESRPFIGLQDFVERVVLPAAGLETLPDNAPIVPDVLASGEGSIIDAMDAVAVYANALNANDVRLAYSTMPFSFVSRDVYDMELRATVNAPSGVERATAVRNQVELIVPQRGLMQIFGRQEDFDEALRIDREAPWWATGPSATSRYDSGSTPPSRVWAHMGTLDDAPYLPGVTQLPQDANPEAPPTAQHVFASREEDGWAQLWASRVAEQDRLQGRVLHFDHETRSLEGRYLPDETWQDTPTSDRVSWVDPSYELLRGLDLSMWIQPRSLDPGVIFDVGNNSLEADRITLAIEDTDLVLRVFDGTGDHPGSAGYVEAGEARYALAGAQDPGLPTDTWTHVSIDVKGTRPDQVTMLVDGRAIGVRQQGMSRLASTLDPTSSTIQLEDAEGFPAQGTVVIGNEIVEFTRNGDTLDCTFQDAAGSQRAGHGGRQARTRHEGTDDATAPVTLAGTGVYQAGTPVSVYGYSVPLASNVSGASASLGEELGRFAVAQVQRVETSSGSLSGEPIILRDFPVQLGYGLEGDNSAAEGLTLAPVDAAMDPQRMMLAFNSSGGYAAIIQTLLSDDINVPQQGDVSAVTVNESLIGGIEIIRYTGVTGTTLNLQGGERGLPFTRPSTDPDWVAAPRAFIVEFTGLVWLDGQGGIHDPSYQTGVDPFFEDNVFVVPISVYAPGSANFNLPLLHSEVAQITHADDPFNTEWMRYDQILGDHLVRNEFNALNQAYTALTHGFVPSVQSNADPDDPGGPGSGGDIGGGGVNNSYAPATVPSRPAPPVKAPAAPAPSAASAAVAGAYWQPQWGADLDAVDGYVVTRAVRSAMQFRGVMGTYSQDHLPGSTEVLPCFRVLASGGTSAAPSLGIPGRMDDAFLVEEDQSALGWPVRVHRAHQPWVYTYYPWTSSSPNTAIALNDPTTIIADPNPVQLGEIAEIIQSGIFVGLDDASPVPVPASSNDPNQIPWEARRMARLTKHPSGEMPRVADRCMLGSNVRGAQIPSVLVDEVTFGDARFGGGTGIGEALLGASMVVVTELSDSGTQLDVQPNAVRCARGEFFSQREFLNDLPPAGGLLRIGEEIVAYEAYLADVGQITLSAGGRGLLGTLPQPHYPGEPVTWLEGQRVAVLGQGVSASEHSLPVSSLDGFPYEGTVLVDDELIHYTRLFNASLEMPRASNEPGKKDRRGSGLFRGRYGTQPAAHDGGTPVIQFPFRYWDRYAQRADGPELSYFGFSLDQPNAFWRGMFWDTDDPPSGGSQIVVLQRLLRDGEETVPWDADPVDTPELEMFEVGLPEGGVNPIGVQADRAEWRVFVRFAQGAFDPVTGLNHAWKESPRLRLFGVEYLGPNLVVRRVDQ